MDKQERSVISRRAGHGEKMLLSEERQYFQSPTLSVEGQCNQKHLKRSKSSMCHADIIPVADKAKQEG